MKLKITENQFKRIKSVLTEEIGDQSYSRDVVMSFYIENYKGLEVNDIFKKQIKVNFNIKIEKRSWGIDDISVSDITGPSKVQTEISYYPQGSEDAVEEMVEIVLDWSKIQVEANKGNIVTIGEEVDVLLESDSNGVLIAKGMSVEVFNL
jgi:hypothetical protein